MTIVVNENENKPAIPGATNIPSMSTPQDVLPLGAVVQNQQVQSPQTMQIESLQTVETVNVVSPAPQQVETVPLQGIVQASQSQNLNQVLENIQQSVTNSQTVKDLGDLLGTHKRRICK